MFRRLGGAIGMAVIAALCAPTDASAFRVAPMVYELAPSGSGTSQVIRVENTDDQPITLEILVNRRSIAPDGTEQRTPAEDDFIVFPPQTVVQPGETQAFRLQYIGPQSITESSTYAITVAQLPIEIGETNFQGIQVVYNFTTTAHVVPPGAEPGLTIVEAVAGPGAEQVTVRLRNAGNKHAYMTPLIWVLRNGRGEEIAFRDNDLIEIIGISFIQPGKTREIVFPVPAGFAAAGGLTAMSRPVE
ncbi:fimbrial chaperone protein [Constrictibacter sp. MBR-5]|jgi:fimbrial chaperone protein|uniref:fimbria/pilus periplasmic chaperone n=1 Tax=Constrictibacter sp. MBR-5 TaxID=3156467 RepID=UPI00339A6F48